MTASTKHLMQLMMLLLDALHLTTHEQAVVTSSLQLATSQTTPAPHRSTSTTIATVDYRSDMKRIIAASSTKDPSTADDTDVSCIPVYSKLLVAVEHCTVVYSS
jgi:hypothetical protein